MKTRKRRNYRPSPKPPKICKEDKLNFEECEQAILREAIEEIDAFQQDNKIQNGPEIKKIMGVVEDFIRRKKLVLYGGQAINSILPRHAQFYGATDIPDYDFFTTDSPGDAKELADIFYSIGYKDVEAKSGVHKGTQKVYVSSIPVADLTQQDSTIFSYLQKEAIIIDGIHYAPVNWLRMGMYLELCRTYGDTTRFEKVLKRLTLLNKYYYLKTPHDCQNIQFQRDFSESTTNQSETGDIEKIYDIVRNTFINQNVVFFGGYALSLYSQYMPPAQRRIIRKISDFDVLSEDIDRVARITIEQLKQAGFSRANIIKYDPIGEIIPRHIEIRVSGETVAFLYEPDECVNYNEISPEKMRIASIDTILRFYLAFIYTGRHYYNIDRLLCMANFLFRVQQENRLSQSGILRRFTTTCIGKQHTLEDIRAEKTKEFNRLRGNKCDPEYEQWFLKYIPSKDSNTEKKNMKNETATSYSGFIKKSDTETREKEYSKSKSLKKKRTQKRRIMSKKDTSKNSYLFG